ncbi:MAG: tetratricopeptide repeat protein [Planctomycetes bacterium]|nr:tetratricopeptide repeat protein [Planctomycetota bacterium]
MAKQLCSGRTYKIVLGSLLALFLMGASVDWYVSIPADAKATYVGRESCARCHEAEQKSWHGSDHDRAMEIATDESVLGDFKDATFTRLGLDTRFFRKGKQFYVNAEGPDGKLQDFEIKYTFGVRPLQQYMIEFPDGRVQVLRVSWDTEKNEWFYVAPPDEQDQRLEPGDPLHWTGLAQNWNTMCAECHSTNLQKNYDLATNTYHTTFSEIDVSCETCHGPGSLHVELAESNSLFWDRHHGYGLTTLKGGTPNQQIETCAPCHSRRSPIHPGHTRSEHFADAFDPSLIREGLYHDDGQILDEVYVYGSFLQSKMYSKDVRCTDCHNPHSLELKFKGNQLCTQCHLPGKYDSPTHHHHTDAKATQCVECHMPSKTYMEIDGRRDHSLRIPRPDLTVELGTPNACNNCHTKPEESPAWAAEHIRKWYGDRRPDDPHFARAIAAARAGTPEGLELIASLLEKQSAPDIIRATAIELLGNYGSPKSDRLCRQYIDDRNPLVRTAALRTISDQSLTSSLQEIFPLLNDKIRLVRITAARRLAALPPGAISPEYRDAYELALNEYQNSQTTVLDRASAHLNLATLARVRGNATAAQKSLENAIRLEPYLSGVRDMLAQILVESRGNPERIRELREQEAELLKRDFELMPENIRPLYRRGMLLYLLERGDEAREVFQQACQLAPESFDNWLALALICEKQHRWQQAVKALQQMQQLRPNDPAIRGIAERIQQAKAEK